MNAPFHVNYYLAPRSEVAERISNIKLYHYMQGVRAIVIPQEVDNQEDVVLLKTYLHTVQVEARVLSSSFTET